METEDNHADPYRILFPLGIASALIGISLWILFQNRWISFYPRQAHANIMFLACLWSFIIGFLMTAVPKMTGTFAVKTGELFVGILLVFMQIILNLRNQTQLSVYVFAAQILFLILFVISRIRIKKSIPVERFFFLPFSFMMGFLGIAHFYYHSNYSTFYLLSCEALVLNLILGLGSRLIPVISRIPNALTPNVSTAFSNKYPILTLAALLNTSYIVEAFYPTKWVLILRFVVIAIFALRYLKLFQRPITFSIVGYGLKIGITMLMISVLIKILMPTTVAASHLQYIGVFLLITLMVATRVMLAHGQQNINYETKSVRIFAVVTLLLLASFSRYFANANINSLLMTLSIYCGILALIIWSHKFVKIMLKSK